MIYIGTHHRCGTVLMRNLFRMYCKKTEQSFFKGIYDSSNLNIDIYQDAHSREMSAIADAAFGIHLFRDPKSLLLSHLKYHLVSESEAEASNRILIDGVVYREYLRSISSDDDKLIFEMNNIFSRTVNAMSGWDYEDERFLNINLKVFLERTPVEIVDLITEYFPDCFDRDALLHSVVAAMNNKVKDRHGTSNQNQLELSADLELLLQERFPSLKVFNESTLRTHKKNIIS
ncbi:MAG: hypothetical protein LAT77_10605 [Aliidiomarina sp.]|uniref:hypothetical protein n=1 Tax=Aliidiomarina sp. TaxID=1872439 RepID=UPI0025B8C184|nr:hypothetical protein [Aliidiomarina sp.]MCH8502345.1 hypothetical protein [Aliidiomarina sp.]